MNYIAMIALAAFAAAQPPASKGSADLGKKIFTAKCTTCHGRDGKGVASMAKLFKVDPEKMNWTSSVNQGKTDAELKTTITNGNGKMPSFKGKLSDGDMANVIAFIRSLQAAAKGASN